MEIHASIKIIYLYMLYFYFNAFMINEHLLYFVLLITITKWKYFCTAISFDSFTQINFIINNFSNFIFLKLHKGHVCIVLEVSCIVNLKRRKWYRKFHVVYELDLHPRRDETHHRVIKNTSIQYILDMNMLL